MRKERLLGKQVWCLTCINKNPPKIQPSHYLVPLREKPYDLEPDTVNIDRRVAGVCNHCLENMAEFQKKNTIAVDINHKHLVSKQF